MANKVKCSQCNLVVDELLAFVQNKLDTMDEESLWRICVSAFPTEVIAKSKDLLFEAVPTEKRKVNRRNAGKEFRNIADIITLFKEVDPELIPVFVARDLHKLPPVTFDHVDVTALLKEIVLLKSAVNEIKSSYVSSEHLENFKKALELELFQKSNKSSFSGEGNQNININFKRGAALFAPQCKCTNGSEESQRTQQSVDNNGPMGITDLNFSSYHGDRGANKPTEFEERSNGICNNNILCLPHIDEQLIASSPSHASLSAGANGRREMMQSQPPPMLPDEIEKQQPASSTIAGQPNLNGTGNTTQQNQDGDLQCHSVPGEEHQRTMAEIVRGEGEWKIVPPRGKRPAANFIQGKTGKASPIPNGKFRAAENKKINIKDKRKDHAAYKMYVSKFKLGLFLDEKIWPEGIIFRRFVHFKPYGPKDENPRKAD